MKRTYTIVVALIAALALSGVLAGCQQVGIGAPTGTPQKKSAQVSGKALQKEGVLSVGVNAANAPFSTDVNGRIVGIDIDMAAALASELGLDLEVVDVSTEGEKALADGTVDVIMGMDKHDSAASCWLSDPYIETAVALFATSSGAIMPDATSKPTIEAQESSMSAWEVNNQFGKESLESVADLKTAFEDLAGGTATFVASDAVIGSYINRTSGTNAQIIGLLQTPGGYCVGVNAANNDLKMAVSNAVDNIVSNGVAGVVQSKWIGETLDLSGYALSEAAARAASEKKKREDEVNGVGSNAVDPSEGQEKTDAESTETTEAAQAETYVDNSGYVDYSGNDYSANQQTYVEDTTDNGYVEPVYEEPVEQTYEEPVEQTYDESGDTGEDVYDDGEGED